jgi:hypothetical protein
MRPEIEQLKCGTDELEPEHRSFVALSEGVIHSKRKEVCYGQSNGRLLVVDSCDTSQI